MMRKVLVQIAKLAFVGGLLWWLVTTGKLDFRQLRVLVDDPVIFAANLSLWTFGYVLVGTLRWHILLRGGDIDVPYWRCVRLQLIGFFFNTAIPGAVGGDIVKAIYVIREQQDQRKTPALLSVLLDRVVGLSALFVIAGLAIVLNFDFFVARPPMWPLMAFIGVGLVGILAGFGVVMFPFKEGADPFVRLLSLKVPGFTMLLKIYQALRFYRNRPMVLVGTVAMSCVLQSAVIAFALLLTRRLTGQDPSFGMFGMIFPIGAMTTALPLAPGGMGVGHVAFDKLFAMVGMTGGANVFNVMVLGQLALNMVGFIPYILHRTKLPTLQELNVEGAKGA